VNDLGIADFYDFFQAAWGCAPYPWQEALLREVIAAGWPPAVALPTGSGKTATLDIALFHMALAPAAPRRVVYVVNRRLVVDQAEERASRLKDLLEGALVGKESSPVLLKVAEALLRMGGETPFQIVKLRGGMPLDRHLVADPAAPTVVLSTVDQAGSRLLFRGYGLAPQAWPVEAGLFGIDTLFLLDEAHLERPFFDTLKTVAKMAERDGEKVGRPSPQIVALTATLATLEIPPEKVFQATEQDQRHPKLSRIWSTSKPLCKVTVSSGPRKDLDPLAKKLAREALRLKDDLERPILVVCNTTARARAVYRSLLEQGKALLLIGRARPYDRERIAHSSVEIQKMVDEGELDFLVSTQAIEVGADLDFGGLVTEHAPLDSLFQRLGRVGRRGRWPTTPVIVIYAPRYPGWPYDKETLANAWA
jgi:CRISPR-associated endonuclease/helicase Cas3